MVDRNGTKYYLHYDQVGSLRAVSNQNSDVVKEIVYDTFGNIISDNNETLKVPFGFAGGLYDRDTKLIHFGFREYDPFIGRWTAKDPILFAGGDSNLYGYVLGDPVGRIDPEGLWTVIYINIFAYTTPQGWVALGIITVGTVGYEVYKHWWSFPKSDMDYIPFCEAKKSKQSQKERSTNAPDWVKYGGFRPDPNEKCQVFAKRVLDIKYGAGKWDKGAGNEYSKIVKWCQRSLRNR